MIKKKLKIEGMHCTSCSMLIDGELEDLTGVKSAKTSYHKGECEVEFDETEVSLDQVLEAIKKTGYRAQDELG